MSAAFQITDFKSIRSDALVGFCDVHLPSGMILHRCSIFSKDDKAWASPPQVISRDGSVARSTDGKVRYEATVSFKDR